MKDFFISYNKEDRAWAEWIAWILEDASYTTVIQAWDFLPGSNFILDMQQAIESAETTIAVISRNYFESIYTQPEWATAFASDPKGILGKLIPVRVDDYKLHGLFKQLIFIDLTKSDEVSSRKKLLAGIRRKRGKPERAPEFPGILNHNISKQPKFPGKSKKVPLFKSRKSKTILAIVPIFFILLLTIFIFKNWVTTPDISQLNPEPKFMIASKYYFLDDLGRTAEILYSIANDKYLSKQMKRACLAFLAKVLVDDGRIKDAEDVINELLDLEPPLITIFPSEKYRSLQIVYENVRNSRFNYTEDNAELNAIAVYNFQVYNIPESKLNYYLDIGELVSVAFAEPLQEKFTIVERVELNTLLEELSLSQSISSEDTGVTRILNEKQTLNKIIEPWVLLMDPINLPLSMEPINRPDDSKTSLRIGRIINATHYIFGSIIFKPSAKKNEKDKVMIMVWMYNIETAQLRIAEHIQGELEDIENVIDLAEQLGNRVCSNISTN